MAILNFLDSEPPTYIALDRIKSSPNIAHEDTMTNISLSWTSRACSSSSDSQLNTHLPFQALQVMRSLPAFFFALIGMEDRDHRLSIHGIRKFCDQSYQKEEMSKQPQECQATILTKNGGWLCLMRLALQY